MDVSRDLHLEALVPQLLDLISEKLLAHEGSDLSQLISPQMLDGHIAEW